MQRDLKYPSEVGWLFMHIRSSYMEQPMLFFPKGLDWAETDITTGMPMYFHMSTYKGKVINVVIPVGHWKY